MTDMFDGCDAVDLVEPENARDLAGSIVAWLQRSDRNEAGRAGRELVARSYSRRSLARMVAEEAIRAGSPGEGA
jgi:hypothetical protein